MKKIILDTDTACDDAVALIMALREPTLQVVAVTTVAGNVDVDTATQNACLAIHYAQTYIPPVYRGAERPLIHPLETATSVHGADGMGDWPSGHFDVPAAISRPQ